MIKAIIVTIGDEILLGQILDTNSKFIARQLTNIGIEVNEVCSIPDKEEKIRMKIEYVLNVSDLVIVTGGLGPTKDDVTKQVLADYFGMQLIENKDVLEQLERLFANGGMRMNERNQGQAMIPDGCRILMNRKGTAPGMWFEKKGKVLVSLPGVPCEMEDLMICEVIPMLSRRYSDMLLEYRMLKVYNIVHNTIDFISNPQYVSRDIHSSQIKKSISYPGDVIMNIVGPPLNKVAIIPNTYAEWNINQAITLFRPKDYLNNKFLYYFFCEGTPVNRLVNQTRGVVGQINISLTQCRNFLIPIPPIQEQREIVKIIDSLFKKVETIEQQYNALKAKIEKLPQALLNKAFSGELVDHLPSDGCAENLLKEIEQLKRSTKKK